MMTAAGDEKIAETDACRIEHIISPETFKGIKKYIKEHKETALFLPQISDAEKAPRP